MASTAVESPVGSWVSPITSELITSKSKGLGSPSFDSKGYIYWTEGRPTEGGRQVIVRRSPDGVIEDVTPGVDSKLNVRTRVHEYGGGAVCLGEGILYFVNFADQRLYQQELYPKPGAPQPLTAEGSKMRFADGVLDTGRSRMIAVCEDHSKEGQEAVNAICAIDLETGAVTILSSGCDFYSNPRLSPDGSQLVWITWDHPNMPWDGSTLHCADVAPDGTLTNTRKVAGGESISVVQPVWSVKGGLYYVSDESGWWNIYYEEAPGKSRNVCPMDADFGVPSWIFGYTMYVELPDGKLLANYLQTKLAGSSLGLIDPDSEKLTVLETEFTQYGNLQAKEVDGKLLIGTTGSSAVKPSRLIYIQVDNTQAIAEGMKNWQVIAKSTDLEFDPGYFSSPESIEYPTTGGKSAFMLYYPPQNKDFKLPPGELPPLLVHIHGGPTSRASAAFSLGNQYWTSRGFAIADVNYGGSSGYGREYRDRLKGQWGVVDVDDCCNAATYLAEQGLVDPKRLCIAGGSAGGYTTLACLAFRDVFTAGASHYGVASMELLAQETHKFESRYLDSLVGKYPEEKELYQKRSPLQNTENFSTPCIFFQGDEDAVVPPNQAEEMYNALKPKGVPTALVMFKGEQHGFRQATNIRTAMDGEFYFYGKVLGFPSDMPNDLPAIEVVNLN